MSYDVKALFTSVPMQPAIDVILKLLEEDGELQQRTNMLVNHINSLLDFSLRSTYFTFQGRLYEQQEGAAMGSPIIPIVANQFMKDFEKKAIDSSPHPHVSGEDLWMIPLQLSMQLTKRVSWNTWTLLMTTYSSPVKTQGQMVPCPFLISWSSQIKMEVWAQLYIGNPLIQICTCSGTATTQCQQSIVWLAHYIIEQNPYAPALNCYNRKNNIFRRHSIDANILHGLWTE